MRTGQPDGYQALTGEEPGLQTGGGRGSVAPSAPLGAAPRSAAAAPPALPRQVPGPIHFADEAQCYAAPTAAESRSPFVDGQIWPALAPAQRGELARREPSLRSGSSFDALYGYLEANRDLSIKGKRNRDLVGTQVKQGQIGLQTDSATRTNTYLYLPGCHTTWTQMNYSNIQLFDIDLTRATHVHRNGTDFHLIVIPPGMRGLALQDGLPIELQSGIHVVKSMAFNFDPAKDVFDVNTHYVKKGSAHFFNIPPGKLCPIRIGQQSYTLPAGQYEFNVANLVCLAEEAARLVDVNTPYFHNGTQHILNVPPGAVALVQRGNEWALYTAGHYFFDDPSFFLQKPNAQSHFFLMRNEPKDGNYVTEVGPFTIITPGVGQVPVIVPAKGKPDLVIGGEQFTIRRPAKLNGFIDINTQTLDIYDLDDKDDAQSKHRQAPVARDKASHQKLRVRTSDGVFLDITAVMTYNVKADEGSLHKAMRVDDLPETLRRAALQELAGLFSGRPYFMPHHDVVKAEKDDEAEAEGEVAHLQRVVQDKSNADLKESLERFGVQLQSLRIVDCTPVPGQKIIDSAAEAQTANLRVDLQTQNVGRRLALAEQEQRVATAQAAAAAMAEAEALRIRTEAQMASMQSLNTMLQQMSPEARTVYMSRLQAEQQQAALAAFWNGATEFAKAGGRFPAQMVLGGAGWSPNLFGGALPPPAAPAPGEQPRPQQ